MVPLTAAQINLIFGIHIHIGSDCAIGYMILTSRSLKIISVSLAGTLTTCGKRASARDCGKIALARDSTTSGKRVPARFSLF